jgi:hypothetical protein
VKSYRTCGFYKMREIYLAVGHILASEDGLSSMQVVDWWVSRSTGTAGGQPEPAA